MTTKHRVIFSTALLAVIPSIGWSATVNLVPFLAGAYDLAGDQVSLATTSPTISSPLIYQIDFDFTIGDLQPTSFSSSPEGGLDGIGFDINLTDGLHVTEGGWHANADTFSVNVGRGRTVTTFTGNIWEFNQDVGANTNDLKYIAAIVGVSGLTTRYKQDPRLTLGQFSPANVGSIYVQWDGKSDETLSLANLGYLIYPANGGNYDGPELYAPDNNVLSFGPNLIGGVAPVQVPEPGSLGMLGAGSLLLRWKRRAGSIVAEKIGRL